MRQSEGKATGCKRGRPNCGKEGKNEDFDMIPFIREVAAQIAYTHAVRDFMRALLRRMLPGRWPELVFDDGDRRFGERLDAAMMRLDARSATAADYCGEVVDVLRGEVSRIVQVLTEVCAKRGYRAYAERFLSRGLFDALLMSRDEGRLARLTAALGGEEKPLCVVLRDVGEVLEGREPDGVAVFGADAVRAAAQEACGAFAAEVKATIRDGLARAGRRRRLPGRAYDERKVEAVNAAWELARGSEEARRSVNTRLTCEAAMRYGRALLEAAGVTTVGEFRKIRHAVACRECRARDKARAAAAAPRAPQAEPKGEAKTVAKGEDVSLEASHARAAGTPAPAAGRHVLGARREALCPCCRRKFARYGGEYDIILDTGEEAHAIARQSG